VQEQPLCLLEGIEFCLYHLALKYLIMEKIDLDRWYRPKIDKTEFRKLCVKSDWQGFKHMIIFSLSLLISGYLAFVT